MIVSLFFNWTIAILTDTCRFIEMTISQRTEEETKFLLL
jgi:hypothetical protein